MQLYAFTHCVLTHLNNCRVTSEYALGIQGVLFLHTKKATMFATYCTVSLSTTVHSMVTAYLGGTFNVPHTDSLQKTTYNNIKNNNSNTHHHQQHTKAAT